MTVDARPSRSITRLSPEATDIARSEQAKRLNAASSEIFAVFYDEFGDHNPVGDNGYMHQAVSEMRTRLDTVVGLLGGPIPAATDRGIEFSIDERLSSVGKLIAIDGQKPDSKRKIHVFMNGDRDDPRFPTATQFTDELLTSLFSGGRFSEADTQGADGVGRAFFEALVAPWEEALGLKPKIITPDRVRGGLQPDPEWLIDQQNRPGGVTQPSREMPHAIGEGSESEQPAAGSKVYTTAEKIKEFECLRSAKPRTDNGLVQE
jgi:hypothetical protein